MNSRFNQDFIDLLNVWNAVIGYMNYQENLTQSDKDDILHQVDDKMTRMLQQIEKDLDEQNKLLYEILEHLQGGTDEGSELLQGEN